MSAERAKSATIILTDFGGHDKEPLVLRWVIPENERVQLVRWAEMVEEGGKTWASGTEKVRLEFRGKALKGKP